MRKEAKCASFKVIFRKKLILNWIRSALTVPGSCGKEAYSATGMESNLRLFDKSRI